MSRFRIPLLALLSIQVFAGEYKADSQATLKARLSKAEPGDVLILPPKILTDWSVIVSRSGKQGVPITIKGSPKGKTILTGKSRILIRRCSYVQLEDLSFSDCAGTIVTFDGARNCSMRRTRFESIKGSGIVFVMGPSRAVRIEDCLFSKNPSKNICIRVGKVHPVGTIIRNNRFEDVPPLGGNGRETIQVGQIQTTYGTAKVKTLVEDNVFLRCSGEAEIISNKSSANIYRGNLFKDCAGQLVMRGGFGCLIEGNRMVNCRGIRLSGKNHIVRNNVVWNSGGPGICLLYGVADKEPAFYLAVSGCIVENNTVVNAKQAGIMIGSGRGRNLFGSLKTKKKLLGNPKRYGTCFETTAAPHQNTIRANVVYSTGKLLLQSDKAPENTVEHNWVYSTDKDPLKPEGETNQFRRIEFADIAGGDFTLRKGTKDAPGAKGAVCKPFRHASTK